MTFAILICGHWIADPFHHCVVGQPGPCPRGDGDQQVIALPDDALATFLTDQE